MTTWFHVDRPGRETSGRRDIEELLKRHRAAQLADFAMSCDRERVRELLAAHADPNHADERGRLPLHAAVFAGKAEVVREILEARADANLAERDLHGNRPLQIAAWQGHAEVTKLLLQSSASVDVTDGRGWTPLCSAAEQGHVATVQVLVHHRADPGRAAAVAGRGSVTPLQAAAKGGHIEVAQVLKEALAKNATTESPGRPSPQSFMGQLATRRTRAPILRSKTLWHWFLGKCCCTCLPWTEKSTIRPR